MKNPRNEMDLCAEIAKMIDIFAKEEIGNRLSQFAMMAFKQKILEIIIKHEKKIETDNNKNIPERHAE